MRRNGVFSQLYMAQILKYKQGPTTCVSQHKHTIQWSEGHVVSMCLCCQRYLHVWSSVCLCVWLFAYRWVCQVALSGMCGCIARAYFVLLRFTGIALVERPGRGSVCGTADVEWVCTTAASHRSLWDFSAEKQQHPRRVIRTDVDRRGRCDCVCSEKK